MDFPSPPSNPDGDRVLGVTVSFFLLALLAVVLRIIAKYIRRRPFAIHDYLIFGAIVACFGSIVEIIIGVAEGGIGLHITQVNDSQLNVTLKTLFAGSWTWVVATVLIKLSMLRLYIELFHSDRRVRYMCHVLELAVGLFGVGIILTIALICRPVQKDWEPLLPGQCGDLVGEEIAAATGVLGLDLSLVLLPMPVLWNLQMPLRKKVVISIMFGMGIIVMALNITRIILTLRSDQTDVTYSNIFAFTLSSLETFLGVIVACLPTLAPLVSPSSYRKDISWGLQTPKVVSGGIVVNVSTEHSTISAGTSDGFRRLQSGDLIDLEMSKLSARRGC